MRDAPAGDGLALRIHARLDDIRAPDWDRLVAGSNPFLAHTFLAGLERHGCVQPEHGWQPWHLGLYRGNELVAAAPAYLKGNSHGEFVFDWSWAEASHRLGQPWYPKLLVGVPYSPVNGPRLLAGSGDDAPVLRRALAGALIAEARGLRLSSVHVNFTVPEDAAAFAGSAWLQRGGWQFHWDNAGWPDFDAFLDALTGRRRRRIRQERARVARAGVECRIHEGHELGAAEWDALHDFYLTTFADKGNFPALTRDFFHHLGRSMPERVMAVLCRRGEALIAGALFLRSDDTLYGRYWGAHEDVPGLHFEACYYQGIEYCLREGLSHFEPGAQGEHKIPRGFLPAATRSFHWIAEPRLHEAIDAALVRERQYLEEYRLELLAHSPFAESR